jgi:hypothetical protein
MHRILSLVLALVGSLGLSACAVVVSPVGNGALFTDVRGPVQVQNGVAPAKLGRACAHNVVGLVAYGDASIAAARKQGGIEQVASIDHDSFSVLSLYSRFCTQLRGD